MERIDPERWEKIKGIFQSAFEMGPAEQSAFLDEACSDDASLRRSVESLLSSDEQDWDLLDRPAVEAAAGLLVEDQPELSEGEMVGYYKVLSLLGTGGMGEVYLAEDIRLGRKIALKSLPAGMIGSEARLQRFRQEARTASTLNHPNIVTIHEITEFEGRHLIATEYIEGETLRQRLRRGEMSVGEALDVAIQVASALAAAHRAGIVHRDIKPENIMLRTDGYAKVLDFGLAKLIERQETIREIEEQGEVQASVSSGLLMGTLRYMSPEQAQGMDVDSRSDIFSFGVVLYELVTGRTPFQGKRTGDLISSILRVEPLPLPEPSCEAWPGLQEILTKALRKDRNERHQAVGEMLADLKNLKQKLERAHVLSQSAPLVGSDRKAIATRDKSSFLRSQSRTANLRLRHIAIALALVVLIAAALSYWFINRNKQEYPFRDMRMSRVSNSGLASDAAISPDGKRVIYAEKNGDQSSIWLREVGTASSIEVAPPAQVEYNSLAFSRDGSSIYYVLEDKDHRVSGLYKMPASGGPARKLADVKQQLLSVSPDEQRIAFVDYDLGATETVLIVARIDGTEEYKVATRKYPDNFNEYITPSWSPEGKSIVCGAMVSDSNGRYHRIVEVELENGKQRLISEMLWYSNNSPNISWLPDGSGLIVVDRDVRSLKNQIWHLSYPDGEARRITNDLNNYSKVSVTADSSTLVALQQEQLSHIWILPGGDTSLAKQITFGPTRDDGEFGVSWSPDGKIVYQSGASGNWDIWIMNSDGTNQKQLTSEADQNFHPSASPDGRYIVFSSYRTGTPCIWRMDADGGNPKQLTNGPHDQLPVFSGDGKWVVYQSRASGKNTLWKVSNEGGDPAQLSGSFGTYPAFSPDGKMIASFYLTERRDQPYGIAIIPLDGGAPAKTFPLPFPGDALVMHLWTPDGSAIAQLVHGDGVSNIWNCPVDGSAPTQLTSFKSGRIYRFDWSRDGKHLLLACGTQTRDVVLINNIR